MEGIWGVHEDSDPIGIWHRFMKHLQYFWHQFEVLTRSAGYVRPRRRETCRQTLPDRIGHRQHHDRSAIRCAHRRSRRSGADRDDRVEVHPRKLLRQNAKPVSIEMPVAAFDDEVLTLHVTVVAQRGDKPAILRRVERLKAGGQDADANGLRRLLAKDGTGTENQYGESSQKEGTRGSLAITHSGPPVHLITASGRSAVHDGQARPRRTVGTPSRFKRVPPVGTAGRRPNPCGRSSSHSACRRAADKSMGKS